VPAHGGAIENGPGFARALKAHRHMRNGQVLAAVADGAHSIGALVSAIYPSQSLPVRMAARMTIAAHVEYLENLGQLSVSRRPWGTRIRAS